MVKPMSAKILVKSTAKRAPLRFMCIIDLNIFPKCLWFYYTKNGELMDRLDEDTEEKIIEIFRELAHKDGKIVIIVTRSKRVAEHADKVSHLRRGNLS